MMKKLIALVLFVLLFLSGIVLVALGIGIGILLLVVGMLGTVMLSIILGSRGSITDIFTPADFMIRLSRSRWKNRKRISLPISGIR